MKEHHGTSTIYRNYSTLYKDTACDTRKNTFKNSYNTYQDGFKGKENGGSFWSANLHTHPPQSFAQTKTKFQNQTQELHSQLESLMNELKLRKQLIVKRQEEERIQMEKRTKELDNFSKKIHFQMRSKQKQSQQKKNEKQIISKFHSLASTLSTLEASQQRHLTNELRSLQQKQKWLQKAKVTKKQTHEVWNKEINHMTNLMSELQNKIQTHEMNRVIADENMEDELISLTSRMEETMERQRVSTAQSNDLMYSLLGQLINKMLQM